MDRQKPHSIPTLARRSPWLAASHGRRLPRTHEVIAPPDAPEAVLDIEFEGLTEAEQRAALEAFPGGRRFRLAASRH